MGSRLRWLAHRAERVAYRAGGLPIAVAAGLSSRGSSPARGLRRAYARYFWRPESATDCGELLVALCLWPVLLLFSGVVLTMRNGPLIARRYGRPVAMQFIDQIRLYVSDGILPPWYYIYSLHDKPIRDALDQYLTRSETKLGVYDMLHRRAATPLGDKVEFARHCERHGLPIIPVAAVLEQGEVSGPVAEAGRLPQCDLFVKPVRGRGGTGAERWDYLATDRYRRADGLELDAAGLLARLRAQSMNKAMLLQPRIRNHPDLTDLSNGGALSTIRAMTCIDEAGRPEVVAAVLRMAVGTNTTVDNFHAGGIASDIDLDTGLLSEASDLGMFTRHPWLKNHPMTGAPITGRRMPQWSEVRTLAERAHAAFGDRILIGWDIAISEAGVVLVEGNSAPDIDILQRVGRQGLFARRLGPLLAFHVARVTARQRGTATDQQAGAERGELSS